jgi:MinD-like ATPase involved in chromosome partitioning or flagellar assembly
VSEDQPGLENLKGKELWLVPSSINSQEISKILRDGYDVNVLNKGMRNLRRGLDLDYLFIDTHPGLNEETLLSFAITDILLVVMRPDQQDFQGTAVTVDIAQGLDVPKLYIVVNKALGKYDFKQIRENVEATYHAPVAGVLPLSEDMVDLGSTDIFALRYPDHEVSKVFHQMAETIFQD